LLRVFLKPESDVVLATYWNFLNGAFGMVRTAVGSPNQGPASEEPVFPLYVLWAEHFGSQLVKVEVQSPKGEFPGAGSEIASRGSLPEAKRTIERVDLGQYSSMVGAVWPKLLNVQIQRHDSDLTIHLQNLSRSIYPLLAQIPRPSVDPGTRVEFDLSFDGRLTPDAGSDVAPMGIGLVDSRGWNQTHSGIGLDEIGTEWKHFDGVYRLDGQTTSVDLSARLMANGKNVTGTLQVKNLVVSESVSGHDAAYPLLTSSASTSSDGKKVYLIVFNKSASDSIPTAIHLGGFSAARAQYWEVNGPALTSTSVTETEHAAALPLSDGSLANHVFPAHSMTAIEFSSAR